MEKILTDPGVERFSLFPIKYNDIWQYYKHAQAANWKAEEVDLSTDISDWEKMNSNEKFFIKNILAFFNASDGIVNENLAMNFYNEVMYPEAKCFYGFQIAIENVHSEMYSLLIDTYIKNPIEKDEAFHALENLEPVRKKADWALKWIQSESFVERLVAFIAVEGIFFSGSFCSIWWLSNRGLMKGLGKANEFINRDENLHCEFAIHLYNNHIQEKLSEQRIYDILLDALEIEEEFITDSLSVDLIGMNRKLMKQYLQYVCDQLLVKLGCQKRFNVQQPFEFMKSIAIQGKENFFEGRPTDYQKADLTGGFSTDEDF